jgi:hypothetical protein
LPPEKQAAMKAELEAAARRPYVYDPDCPLLTEEQLAQFKPVNFATMEERAEAMKAAGIIIDVDEEKQLAQKEPALV